MNKQKENIETIIGKIVCISLFLLVLFVCRPNHQDNSGTAKKVITTEFITKINNSAVLASIDNKCIEYAIVTCSVLPSGNCINDNQTISYSNSRKINLIKICKERFIKIKPQILGINLYPGRTSLNNEDIALI